MKKIVNKIGLVLAIVFFMQSCAGRGGGSETTNPGGAETLLSFFTLLPSDTTISTLRGAGFMRHGNDLSDELVLRYFLNNDKDALYAQAEAFNADENTYTIFTYKRRVTCLFAKQISENLYLLAYWWDRKDHVELWENHYFVWLSLYDSKNGRFTDSRVFHFDTEFHEPMKRGIIFDDNHIFTVEIIEENGEIVSYLEYFAIDKNSMKFVTLQRSRTSQVLWLEAIFNTQRSVFIEELRRAGFTFEITDDGRIDNNSTGSSRLRGSVSDKNNPQSILYAFLRFREWEEAVGRSLDRSLDRMIVDSLAANHIFLVFYVTNDTTFMLHEWGLESIGERRFGDIRDFKDDYERIWVRLFSLDTVNNSIAFQGHFAKGLEEEEDRMFFFTYQLLGSLFITEIDGTYRYNPESNCPKERFTFLLAE